MPLKWRKCRDWLPCVRRVANVGVVAADVREPSAEMQKPYIFNAKAQRHTGRQDIFNTETQRLKGTESIVFRARAAGG